MRLEYLESLLDKVAKVECLALCVVNLVSQVHVLRLVQIEDREDLPVVGNEGLTDRVRA